MIESFVLAKFLHDLRKVDQVPKRIEVCALNPKLYLASTSPERDCDATIANNAANGYARSRSLAILKCLVEGIERRIVKLTGQPSSNGFAGFPVIFCHSKSQKMARLYSYFEAVERFVWRRWWEDKTVGFECFQVSKANSDLVEELAKTLRLKRCFIIVPSFAPGEFHCEMAIACVEMTTGVVLGGAVRSAYVEAEFKALTEALTHALALQRWSKQSLSEMSHYERRIFFLSTNKNFFIDRLQKSSQSKIFLPQPIVDESIVHPYQHFCSVHRLLFSEEENVSADFKVGYI